MDYIKEKTKDVAASAKAGMEKTEATAEEKVDKMKTRNPEGKAAAEEHKAKINKAGTEKQAATKVQGVEGHPSNPGEHKLARTDGDRITTDPI